MEKKINIAKILKDCPTGTKLYSPLCGECRVLYIYDGLSFDVICGDDTVYNFSYDGRYNIMGECCIFPSKECRDWSKFQRPFKDGDIVAFDTEKGAQLFIFKEYIHNNDYAKCVKCYMMLDCGGEIDFESDGYYVERLATEEEKEILFQAIKDNGYKWNAETKTLEKVVESRFHAGDWITDGISKYQILFIDDIQYWYSENGILGSIESVDKRCHHWTIQDAEDGDVLAFDDDTIVIFKDLYNKTTFHSYCHIEDGVFSISELDCPDWWDIKFKPATKEQRDFLFQKIKEAGYRWNAETKTLEKLVVPKFKVGDRITDKNKFIYRITEITDKGYKLHDLKTTFITFEEADWYFVKVVDIFDINTLIPFESRVLVRSSYGDIWRPAIYGVFDSKKHYHYVVGGSYWTQCIPYNEETKHLLGTTNDCDNYYKNW